MARIVLLLAAMVAMTGFTQAQTLFTAYVTKFACGYKTGKVPLLSDPNLFPHVYENYKPGNYATSINVTNPNFAMHTVYAFASLPGSNHPVYRIEYLGIWSLGTEEIGCKAIAIATGNTGGKFFEGTVILYALGDVFKVRTAYTYSSRDAFERHVVWHWDG
ncbi:MAG: hypothetical protein V3T83_18835, partial [Acidobacteriota bacterium]